MGEGGGDGEQGTVKGRKEDGPEPGRGQGREPVSKKKHKRKRRSRISSKDYEGQ